jgi:hypothetical protein
MLPGCSLGYWLGDLNGYHETQYILSLLGATPNCENHPHSTIPSHAVLPILASDTDLIPGIIGHLTSLPTLAKSKCRSTTPFGIGGQGVRSGWIGKMALSVESGLIDSTAYCCDSAGRWDGYGSGCALDVDRPARAGRSEATG